jgi:hypothetical protein
VRPEQDIPTTANLSARSGVHFHRFRSGGRHGYSKVPEITAYFWIVKALTTAMGESTSDFLVHSLVPEIAVVLGGIALVVALYLQFTKDRYVPWAYWLAVSHDRRFRSISANYDHSGLGDQ